MEEKFIPMVECLQGLGVKKEQVGLLITRFPQVLGHSVEEKLVPTLAFLQVRPYSCTRGCARRWRTLCVLKTLGNVHNA